LGQDRQGEKLRDNLRKPKDNSFKPLPKRWGGK